MKQEQNFDLIISKALCNEADSDQVLELHEWLKEETNRDEFLILKEYFSLPATFPEEIRARIAFEKMEKQTLRPAAPERSGFWLKRWSLVAAAVTVAVCVTIAALSPMRGDPIEHYIYNSSDNIQQLTLPDGTSVSLNKNSRLSYTDGYAKKERLVELEGEAWFDVARSGSLFRVKLYKGEIGVLGTKFNVKANPAEELIVTSLEQGRIVFRGDDFEQAMSPGEQLLYDTRLSRHTLLAQADTRLASQWRHELYRYRSITMEELCLQLETIYEVEIALHARLRSVKVSGGIDTSRDIDYVLEIMKNSLKFDWRQNGKMITID